MNPDQHMEIPWLVSYKKHLCKGWLILSKLQLKKLGHEKSRINKRLRIPGIVCDLLI